MKSISVIIPTRNRASLLAEALRSVFAQERAGALFDLDVVVVDDASSDAASDIVHEFPGVTYIRNDECRGAAATRNIGIKASRGEYLAFLDDDDLWLPYKLALQAPVLDENPHVDLVYSQLIVRFENRVWMWPEPQRAPSGSVFRSMLMGNFLSIPTVLFRREALERSGYCDESLPAWVDYDLWLRLARVGVFRFVPGPVAIYRLARNGVYLSALSGGRSEEILRAVMEKNLTTMPNDLESRSELIADARASAALSVAEHYTVINDYRQAAKVLEKMIQEFPCSLHKPWARLRISRLAAQCALAAEDPVESLSEFCRKLMAGTNGLSLPGRLKVRALVARVWKDLALRIDLIEPAPNGNAAAIAAGRALRANPALLGRALSKVICRNLVPAGSRQTPNQQ